MANALYDKFKEECLSRAATPDLSSDDIRLALIDLADYTFSAAHDFLDDVPAGARVATSSAALGSQTVTGGVFDAADEVLSSVSGDESEALILYFHTGVDATAKLIAFIDTGVTGLPVTPNGGDINVNWDSGANKIFAL
jgi:hypothetical protein